MMQCLGEWVVALVDPIHLLKIQKFYLFNFCYLIFKMAAGAHSRNTIIIIS